MGRRIILLKEELREKVDCKKGNSEGTSKDNANCPNGCGIPLFRATRRFWGFPMGVNALPAAPPDAVPGINTDFGFFSPNLEEIPRARGVSRSASPSFTKKAERSPSANITKSNNRSKFLVSLQNREYEIFYET